MTRQQRRKAERDALKQQTQTSRNRMDAVVPMSLEQIAFQAGLAESEVTESIKELNAIGASRLHIDGDMVKGRMT